MKRALLIVLGIFTTLLLQSQTSWKGKVVDSQDNPVGYVFVVANGKHDITDEDGTFELELGDQEQVTLKVQHLGYKKLDTTLSHQEAHLLVLTEDIYLLSEIEVNTSWIKEKEPFTNKVLTKEDLEEVTFAQDIPVILSKMPSMVHTSDAGNGVGYTQFRIRGTDPQRTNITIDGIPLNEPESQGVFWVNMPDFIETVQSVQVQRGLGATTNGQGAFGATVNLITEKYSQDPYAKVGLNYGSFNTMKANIKGSTGLINEKWSAIARASYIRSDGYIDRASANMYSAYAALSHLGENSLTNFKFFHGKERTYHAWNGVPAQYIDDKELRKFNFAGYRPDGSFYDNQIDNFRQNHFHLIHNQDLGENRLSLKLRYTDGDGFFEEYEVEEKGVNFGLDFEEEDLVRRRWLSSDYTSAMINYNWNTLGPEVDLEIGLTGSLYKGEHFGQVLEVANQPLEEIHEYYFNDAAKNELSSYLKLNWEMSPIANLFADVQWRKFAYTFQGIDLDLSPLEVTRKLDFVNPKLGVFISPNKSVNYYASFGIGHKEPNRDDYVDAAPNDQPQVEVLNNIEIGMEKTFDQLIWKSNFYGMFYKNQLALNGRINDVGEYVRSNVDKSYRVGFETELLYQIDQNWSTELNFTLSQNKIVGFIEYFDNWDTGSQEVRSFDEKTDLAFSPNIVGFHQIMYTRPNFSIAFDTKYVGRQFLDNTSDQTRKIDAYMINDLLVTYQPRINTLNNVRLKLYVNNLFNFQYVSNGWTYHFKSPGYNPIADDPYVVPAGEPGEYNSNGYYPQAGTNFMLGLDVSF